MNKVRSQGRRTPYVPMLNPNNETRLLRAMKRFLFALFHFCFVLVALAGCSDDPDPVGPGPSDSAGTLYVLNQADGTIYKLDAGTLVRTDSLSTPIAEPHFVEFAPDGAYYYVVGRQVGGELAKYRTSDDSLMARVTVQGSMFPTALVISPNSDTAYVCDFTNVKGRTHRYDVSGASFSFVDSTLQAGYQSHDIDISPDNKYIVSAGFGSDDISVIDLVSGNLTPQRLETGAAGFGSSSDTTYGPYGVLAVQPHADTTMAVLACRKGTDQIRLLDIDRQTVIDSIIVPTSNSMANPAMVGPALMALAPDNDILYVTGLMDNALYVVRLSTRQVLQTVPFATMRAFTVATNADGSRVYVSCTNDRTNTPNTGRIYMLDGATYQKLDSVTVGSEPFGMYWRP